MISNLQVAQSYDWTMLASLLGQCTVCEGEVRAHAAIARACEELLDMLNETAGTKPVFARFDGQAARGALRFLTLLSRRLAGPGPVTVLPVPLREQLKRYLLSRLPLLEATAEVDLKRPEILVDLNAVESMFELPGLFSSAAAVANEELLQFKENSMHPEIPPGLKRRIRRTDAIRGMADVLRILRLPSSQAIRLVQDARAGRYMSWAMADRAVEYFIPEDLQLASFFSWDFPHNYAHALHLAVYADEGSDAYLDRMNERSYHEAVAVYAEHLVLQRLNESKAEDWALIREEWIPWLIHDRQHEFLLRNVRLLADHLGAAQATFSEIADEICAATGIERCAVEAEIMRYYAWFGLGAVYATGYRRLERYARPFAECVVSKSGRGVRTWNDFLSQ